MKKPTKKDYIEVIRNYKLGKCPTYSNKKKDELVKIAEMLELDVSTRTKYPFVYKTEQKKAKEMNKAKETKEVKKKIKIKKKK